MKNIKSITIIALAILVLVVTAFTYSPAQAAANAGRGGPTQGRGQRANTQSTSATTIALTEQEKLDLASAIQEEYTAMNTYLAVVEQLGGFTPFTRIALSEQQHVNALIRLAERLGMEVPENAGAVADIEWTTYAEACQMGATFEQMDADLYDQLLLNTTNASLTRVYTNLQAASLNNHLPAFESCVP